MFSIVSVLQWPFSRIINPMVLSVPERRSILISPQHTCVLANQDIFEVQTEECLLNSHACFPTTICGQPSTSHNGNFVGRCARNNELCYSTHPQLYQDRPIRISLRFRSRSACWVVSVRESNHWLAVLNEQQNEIHLGELNSLATVTDKFFSDDTIRHLADAFSRTCDSLWTVYVWGNISCGFNCSV